MDAKAQGGTNPLSDTLPAHVKQKRIVSQMLPFSQGWLSLLSTPRNLLPLSPFPCHQEAQVVSLLARTRGSPTHIPSDLERGEGGKGHSRTGCSLPGLPQTLGCSSSTAWFLPRSENDNRFSVGLLGLDGRSCLTARLNFTSSYLSVFSC